MGNNAFLLILHQLIIHGQQTINHTAGSDILVTIHSFAYCRICKKAVLLQPITNPNFYAYEQRTCGIGICKEQNVNPRMYLNDAIAKMPYIKTDPLNDPPYDQVLPLLPHLWIQSHPEAKLDTSNQ